MTRSLKTIKKFISYNPETGKFFWIKQGNWKAVAGRESGSLFRCAIGLTYRIVSFGRTNYLAHRLAWWWIHGKMPPDMIDHINGNGLDNRICNLRLATQSQNMANWTRRAKRNCYRGVSHKGYNFPKPWQARIGHQGVRLYLGTFANKKDAARAYDKAAKELFGEFAKLNFPRTV